MAEARMIEMMAIAIMVSGGCGCQVGGEPVLCDDPRVAHLDHPDPCDCRVAARAALSVLARPENITDTMLGAFTDHQPMHYLPSRKWADEGLSEIKRRVLYAVENGANRDDIGPLSQDVFRVFDKASSVPKLISALVKAREDCITLSARAEAAEAWAEGARTDALNARNALRNWQVIYEDQELSAKPAVEQAAIRLTAYMEGVRALEITAPPPTAKEG